VLFKAMVANGLSERSGPVAVMLAEHEMGRAYTRGMRDAAQRLASGDKDARIAVLTNARGYTALLRQHIAKEDGILFPMADDVIPASQYDAVWDAFEHVEYEETGAGVHEKYLALAGAIEQEANQ
jgi:hemerythrin-like domain-containing protein